MDGDVAEVLKALTQPRHNIALALDIVPSKPGLYAVYANDKAERDLAIDARDGRLYVGKAEDSLVRRDLRTHFATGRTGSSTLRRSFAALLAQKLDLHAVPRNTAKPDGSANFGLPPEADERLTAWMLKHLTLAVWVAPPGADLDTIETAVIGEWQPPLNLRKVAQPSLQLKAARQRLADEARAWRPE